MARSYDMGLDGAGALGYYNFGWRGLPPGTVVKDPIGFKGMGAIDARKELQSRFQPYFAQLKALMTTSGSTGTAGQAMIPVFVDPSIVDQERRMTPMREIIPRVTNLGITADWNERTTKGDASSKIEDAPLADNTDTYARSTKSIKYYYSVGRVTGPTMAAMPPGSFEAYTTTNFPNARQLELAARSADLAVREEIDLISGNPSGTYTSMSTNTDTGYDANSVLASAQAGIKNQISDENQTDQAGAAVTIDAVNDMINLCWEDGGRTNLMLTDGRTMTDIKALMVQQLRYAPSTEIAWGFQTVSFNGPQGVIPIVQSQNVRTTAGDGSGTIYGSKSILALDMAHVENRILLDYTYEPFAKTNDSDKFMVKYYGCVAVKSVNTTDATSFHGSLIDIS